ncbi:putative membrane-associated zinc metalloprotease [Dinoroseobacter shibae DFL 12 = DSM 16493]|uniref:Zinc metalloprotease n=1 Tax=Dinoroseobacter shibae (strain DSM 16493 / NCIMB 14021 / DFL 12) TaxID=398580 RepID=A8LK41_DINSH|nr:RIP metalloprotease RseP [Dinoroseobacter shibae]ABV93240.1 putative membrane-associated zinc metalloprotease [Dinoroseobacter shibae DFL 12 = DSM 16493]URF48159.1 RIP metalloprotease RseP [Dinoroseobacter shibae]URF52469.1 RIP metalloprotease RseP [Dinoroseobacter shibae]
MDLVGLIPSFGGLAFTIIAFIVALSVIVAIHEYGHYIVGRWCGIHAEVFSLGFGPVLYKRTDRRGTQWQVAALPFGGYVKFLGDADAASGKDGEGMSTLSEAELARTMHGAKLWKRAATVAAGPVFNFILSIVIFGGMILWQGTATERPTIGALTELPVGVSELERGDVITAIEGEATPDYTALNALRETLPREPSLTYTVERDGSTLNVQGPFIMPPLVSGLQPRSAAMDQGFEVGDVITAIDGTPIYAFEDLREAVEASAGADMVMAVWRDGETVEITVAPRRMDLPLPEGGFETRWLIGITGGMFFEPETVTPGPLMALWQGVEQMWFIIRSSLSGLWHMITGAISTCNISGPIGIAETSGAVASQGLDQFIWFIAVLSTAVGMLNLFPVPVLDGGHLVFHAYEAVTGKPPSDKALRVMMTTGLALLLTLMVFALSNDLFCP